MSGERLAFDRLELARLPGLERGGFTLEDLSPGISVIHGPNASGKSTTGRAIEQLLWPERGVGERRHLRGELRIGAGRGGARWEVELEHDRRDWWRGGEPADGPALPPAHHADRYGLALHELVAVEGPAEGAFARRIAEEAAGGFDLAAARRRVGAKERPTRPVKAVQEHDRAARRVRDMEREQRDLQAEAARLAELRAELERAREALERLAGVEAAVRWHQTSKELAEARGRLDRFPPVLERLAGDELQRLDQREQEVEEADRDLQALQARVEAARRERDEADLPEEGVPGDTLGTLRRWVDRLLDVERRATAERRELAQAEERRARARSALGEVAEGDDVDDRLEALGPTEWERLVQLARRVEKTRAEESRLENLDRWLGGAAPPSDLERLRDGVHLLRRWLARPVPGWRAYGPAVLAGLGAIALGGAALAEVLVLPPEWPDAVPGSAVGAGALTLLWVLLDRWSFARRRRELAAEDDATRLEPPSRWTEAEVRAALGERERLFDQRRLEAEKAALHPGLKDERRDLERRTAELDAERAAIVEAMGAAPALGDDVEPAPLAAFADALARWREAHQEVGERRAACAGLEHQREHLTAEIDAGLRKFGLGPVDGADRAASAVDDLGRRAQEHRRATEALAGLTGPDGEIRVVEERLGRKREAVAELFRRAGLEPGDLAGLHRLVDEHPKYLEQRDRARDLDREARQMADALPEGPAGEELRAADPDALAAERERLGAVAGRREELIRRIENLETRIGEAERGEELQASLAELEEKEAILRAAREEEADALVAWELAAWVRRSIAQRHQPAVLRGTRELFARFTRGRYELLEPDGDPPAFRARETETGRVRRLRALSAGTRVQLLLAVRLAFVEHQERGPRLPLVLDETLANSDEWAAQAVIETLIEVARGGRQVIYLTAQHDEVAKWRAALAAHADAPPSTVIDLERVRRGGEAEALPWEPVEAWTPEIPPPDGMDRDEYARALEVPGIDPRSGVGAVHLWYLIDDLEVLHRLLRVGISRWGELATLLETGETLDLLGSGERPERAARVAAARADCLEAISRAWRRGRGRPVDRKVLADSGAVTDTFIDAVSELAAELDGDPARLLRALRDGRIKRFQKAKIEQLEDYLLAEDHLDERPRLDRDEIRTRVLGAVAGAIGEGVLTFHDVDALLERVVD